MYSLVPLSCVEKNWQFLVLKALVIVKGKQSAHKLVTLREESCVCYDVVVAYGKEVVGEGSSFRWLWTLGPLNIRIHACY